MTPIATPTARIRSLALAANDLADKAAKVTELVTLVEIAQVGLPLYENHQITGFTVTLLGLGGDVSTFLSSVETADGDKHSHGPAYDAVDEQIIGRVGISPDLISGPSRVFDLINLIEEADTRTDEAYRILTDTNAL